MQIRFERALDGQRVNRRVGPSTFTLPSRSWSTRTGNKGWQCEAPRPDPTRPLLRGKRGYNGRCLPRETLIRFWNRRACCVQLGAVPAVALLPDLPHPSTTIVYQDLISGDELLSDSFTYKELFNEALWEVEGKWVVKGALDVDSLIGANASAEGGEEDAGVDDQAVKVVVITDTFRLQEQPAFDKKGFMGYIKKYLKNLTPLLPEDRQAQFKKDIESAVKFLLPQLGDFQFFVGESMKDDSSLVFAHYKDGASDPTFLYSGDALKEVKC